MNCQLNKRFGVFLCALSLILLSYGCSAVNKKKIRIVLLTIDALRYDTLMGQGDNKLTDMPLTFEIAKKGMIYERFFSSTSTTQPSFATMFTASHPWQHGVTRNGQVLDGEQVTLSEVMKKNGFSTHAVIASFPLKSEMGFAQGFDEFSEDFTQRFIPKKNAKPQYALADTVYEKMRGQLENAHGSKQFFWFHFFDAHAPYGDATGQNQGILLKQPFNEAVAAGESINKLKTMVNEAHSLYNQDAMYLDKVIAKLLVKMTSDKDEYETHIIFVADHGESFGEDGSFGHGRRLTPSEIHVPCFIISPKVKSGMSDDLAGSIDIMPTVLSMAGIEYASLLGRSLLEVPPDKYAIYGMRRTFEKPYKDARLDGEFHLLHANQYYMMQSDGDTFIGNADSVIKTGNVGLLVNQKQDDIKVKQKFEYFEGKIKKMHTVILKDKKTISALKSLGYAQ